MTRVPRDIGGGELAKALRRVGYRQIRQKGSHIRLVTEERGVHHITVPDHNPLPIGTFTGIVGDVSAHLGISRDQLLDLLFG